MDASDLEALRLQALQSLKTKRPADTASISYQEDGEISSVLARTWPPARGPANAVLVSNGVPSPMPPGARQVSKIKKKRGSIRKAGESPRLVSPLPPAEVFSAFTSRLVGQTFTYPENIRPPPKPGSFLLPATSPGLGKASSARATPRSYIIDIDSSDQEEPGAVVRQSIVSVLPIAEPGEIQPSPAQLAQDKEQLEQVELNLAFIKKQLANLDSSYKQNEDLINTAIAKHLDTKKRLKQYTALINKGKDIKLQLSRKKKELFSKLVKMKQAAETLSSALGSTLLAVSPSSPVSMQSLEAVPDDLSLSSTDSGSMSASNVQTDAAVETQMPVTDAAVGTLKAKRKADIKELELHLNRVQHEMERNKLALILSKERKAEKKKAKKEQALIKDFSKFLVESKTKATVLDEEPLADLGDELVLIDGHLVPLEIVKRLWTMIKTISPPVQERRSVEASDQASSHSTFESYDSPLRWFKSSLFFDYFLEFCSKKGALSPTFSNKIDPMLPFCQSEFEFGCTDKNCGFQHFKQVQLSSDALLESIIQRLLEFHPKKEFETKADVLRFIHERLSGSELKGVPMVSLVMRLVGLKKDISDEASAVRPLEPGAAGTAIDKFSSARLKSFIFAANNLPGRCFLELTRSVLRREARPSSRYYTDESFVLEAEKQSEIDVLIQGLPEDMQTEGGRLQALQYLSRVHPEQQTTRILVLDLASALSRTPPTSLPAGPESRTLIWMHFLTMPSFEIRCQLAAKLLADIADPDELASLVFGLAKSAVDSGLKDTVSVLFLAVLKSQMSLRSDDVLPCAQLCALPFDLEPEIRCRFWLFYWDYLSTGAYAGGWFLEYPYDSSYDSEYFPLISWRAKEVIEGAAEILTSFLPAGGEVSELAAYNLAGLRVSCGAPPLEALKDLPIQQGLRYYFSLPEGHAANSVLVEDDPFSVLVHAYGLWKFGLSRLAADLVRRALANANLPHGSFHSLLKVFSLAMQGRSVADEVRTDQSLLFRIGRSVRLGTPFQDSPTAKTPVQTHLDTSLELSQSRRRRPRLLLEQPTFDDLADLLLSNPADARLWQEYMGSCALVSS